MAVPVTPADAAPVQIYSYDASHHAGPLAYTTTERGPPASYDNSTLHGVDDPWSRGASAGPGGGVAGPTTTYTASFKFVQVAAVAATPQGSAEAGLGVSDRAGVAANAGDDLTRLYRAVDPAELKDIAGTGVYRAAPGGTEGKYFFPTKEQAENFSNLMGKTGTGPVLRHVGLHPQVDAQRHRDDPPGRGRNGLLHSAESSAAVQGHHHSWRAVT